MGLVRTFINITCKPTVVIKSITCNQVVSCYPNKSNPSTSSSLLSLVVEAEVVDEARVEEAEVAEEARVEEAKEGE